MEVEVSSVAGRTSYRGKVYYFCSSSNSPVPQRLQGFLCFGSWKWRPLDFFRLDKTVEHLRILVDRIRS